MKTIILCILTGLSILNTAELHAQNNSGIKVKTIEPYKLEISKFKTTNIIFPYPIISVDRGSQDILVQKANGVENILQLKAAKEGFPETNLTVITSDGKLNSIVLSYATQPSVLNFSISNRVSQSGIIANGNINEAEIQTLAERAAFVRKKLSSYKDKLSGITFQVTGVYIQGDVLYFRVRISNQSNIDYTIDQLRFYIRDKKKASRTSSQEIEISPLYTLGEVDKVTSKGEDIFVFALPKFTIPDKKYFTVELMEKNGGRHLALKINNSTILKATPLSGLAGKRR